MSPGTIRYAKRYTRAEIRANPNTLYVFGDNVAQYGRGGQAAECRGEPNAVGIPTKWSPSMDEESFFTDEALLKPVVLGRIGDEFRRLRAHLASGGNVVWPADGVGTGLAQLPQRAPAVAELINRYLGHLAQADTRPKGGDANAAPALPSGTVAEGDAPITS